MSQEANIKCPPIAVLLNNGGLPVYLCLDRNELPVFPNLISSELTADSDTVSIYQVSSVQLVTDTIEGWSKQCHYLPFDQKISLVSSMILTLTGFAV